MGERLVAIAGDDAAYQGSDRVDILDMDDTAAGWVAGPPAPYRALYALAVGIDQGVLLIGGVDYATNAPRPEVWLLDLQATGWTKVADMPSLGTGVAAHCRGGVLPDGRVVVLHSQTAVHILDPSDWSWEAGPSAPEARQGPGVAVQDVRLFVAGGRVSSLYSTRMDILDTTSMTWMNGIAMPEARGYHTLTGEGPGRAGMLAIAGMPAVADDVIRCNFQSSTWELRYDPMPWGEGQTHGRPHEHAAVRLGDNIWYAGGWMAGVPSAEVGYFSLTSSLAYFTISNPGTHLALPVGRYGLSLAAMPAAPAEPEPITDNLALRGVTQRVAFTRPGA